LKIFNNISLNEVNIALNRYLRESDSILLTYLYKFYLECRIYVNILLKLLNDFLKKKYQITQLTIVFFVFSTAFLAFTYQYPVFFRIVNYLFVIISVFIFSRYRKYPKYIYFIFLFFLSIFFTNYVFAENASLKWLINSYGFFLVFLSYGVVHYQCTDLKYVEIERTLHQIVMFISLAFLGIVVYAAMSYPAFANIAASGYNSNVNYLGKTFGIWKPWYAKTILLILIWSILSWKQYTLKSKVYFLLFFVLSFPFFRASRSITYALVIVLIIIYVFRRKLTIPIISSFVLLFIVFFTTDFVSFIYQNLIYFDRGPSLYFAIHSMTENIFGYGNGGYHFAADQFNSEIHTSTPSNALLSQGANWRSPESMVVYFIGSFGVLSIPIFILLLVFLIFGFRCLRILNLCKVEKFILYYNFLMIISGIGSYNVNNALWWAFLGAGWGVILRRNKEIKLHSFKVNVECNANFPHFTSTNDLQ
jgi:hypothetical protein